MRGGEKSQDRTVGRDLSGLHPLQYSHAKSLSSQSLYTCREQGLNLAKWPNLFPDSLWLPSLPLGKSTESVKIGNVLFLLLRNA